uniref:Uncharacterized protein n=1 Tax=Romanomermis culicivorax TaxID=13658 RepID=A0A915HS59_ROMCU
MLKDFCAIMQSTIRSGNDLKLKCTVTKNQKETFGKLRIAVKNNQVNQDAQTCQELCLQAAGGLQESD